MIRATTVKLLEYARNYTCAKCKLVFAVQEQFELHCGIPKPVKCVFANAQPAVTHALSRCPGLKDGEPCDSTKFAPTDETGTLPAMCRDYQVSSH